MAYIADLTETNYPQVEAALLQTDADLRRGELSQANLGQVMTAMNQRARQQLGSGYATYVRLKLQGIADDLADIVARAYAYPPASGQASFARMVMLAAVADRVAPERAEASEVLIGFLRTFNLGFTDRRLRFVIQGVNDAYRKDDPRLGPLDAGGRERLDTVKAELYAKLEELWDVVSPMQAVAETPGQSWGGCVAPSQGLPDLRSWRSGPWVRIVSGVVGEETVMGSLLGRLRPPRAARRRAPTVRPGHPRPARRRTRTCGRLSPDHMGQAHMERSG